MLAGVAAAAAFAGFLPFNIPRARVFLGDVGSHALGAAQWTMALWAYSAAVPLAVAVAPVVVYSVDVLATLAQRARRGKPLTEAHHEHYFQRVQEVTGVHFIPTLITLWEPRHWLAPAAPSAW